VEGTCEEGRGQDTTGQERRGEERRGEERRGQLTTRATYKPESSCTKKSGLNVRTGSTE
jgi:hypothetical protein